MKPSTPRAAALAAPKQQRNWDWRPTANFICGGAGGGLLLAVAFAGIETLAARIALLLGLALIATPSEASTAASSRKSGSSADLANAGNITAKSMTTARKIDRR